MNIQQKIGQRLVIGLPGTEMDRDFVRLIRQYKIGNVILFRRNVKNCAQLKRLCADIQELVQAETGYPAFIGIDQEGGCVTRLSEDAVNVAGQMALAATGDPENARRAAALTAHELQAVGVNFNFTPSADVNNNPNNPIIGVRSFSDDPQTAARFVAAAVQGYLESGMLPAVKHFPGHGDTAQDTHTSLPLIDKTVDELEQLELIPFRAAFEAGCPAVMTTHIVFPKIEPDGLPSTMSRRIITGLLKERLGFRGLVVSDCMEMDAIKKFFGTPKGVVAALAAGVDLTLVSHTASLQEQSFLEAVQAVENGRIPMDELDASVEKILAYKARFCRTPEDVGPWGTPAAQAESQTIRAKSITLARGTIPPLGENPLFAGCADFQSGLASNAETSSLTFPEYMASHLGGEALVTSSDPTAEEVVAAAAKAAGHSAVVVCSYNGHIHPGQMALLKAMGETGLPMIGVALRNPYDLNALPDHAAAIAAWDYTPMTLAVLAPVLSGEQKPTGVMPIRL